ncbi:MAG: hypothetical protein QGF36_01750 [Candidatus Marinimicrobia bacterium]|nr:hypothetical protein [Candidatus Neomarinimicrobiota bacterium]
MQTLQIKLMKRTLFFVGYAFFLTSLPLWSQEDLLHIQIKNYANESPSGIPVVFDEAGENTYILNKHIPSILEDYKKDAVRIDGSSGLPPGSFYLPKILPVSERDSVRNTSQLDYKKGDYDLFELGVGLQVFNIDSTHYHFQAMKRNLPVIYQSSLSSDFLQNYLLSVTKESGAQKVRISAFYHLEEYNLPVNTGLNRRVAEGFHSGIQYKRNWKNVGLEIHPALEVHEVNWAGATTQRQIYWNDFESVWSLRDNFSLGAGHSYKSVNLEFNNEIHSQNYTVSHVLGKMSSGRVQLNLGGAIAESLFDITGKIEWRGVGVITGLKREIKPYFIQDNYYYKNAEYISINSLYILRNIEYYKVLLEVYEGELSTAKIAGGLAELTFQFPWLSSQNQFGIYSSAGENRLPLSSFAVSNIFFSPNIWFWQDARYQPFLQLETTFLGHGGENGFNPLNPAFIIPVDRTPYNSMLVNAEIGFLVKGFRVSYRWVKFNLLDEIQNSTHPDSYNIVPLRYLNISWQFLN